MKIIAFIFLALLGLSEDVPRSWMKAGERAVSKSFKGEDIQMGRKFLEASPGDDRPSPGIVIFELKNDQKLEGYLILTSAKGRHNYFDYLVIYDSGFLIQKVQVFDYRSDHGFEICNKRWLSQFEGEKGCDLEYGSDIDAISGATYSASSITEDLAYLCQYLHENLK